MERKLTTAIGKAGRGLDGWVTRAAARHRFSKAQVWLGFAVAALAAVGAVKLLWP